MKNRGEILFQQRHKENFHYANAMHALTIEIVGCIIEFSLLMAGNENTIINEPLATAGVLVSGGLSAIAGIIGIDNAIKSH